MTLVTLAIACRAICCIGELDQPQSVTTGIACSGNTVVPLQREGDPRSVNVDKQVPPSALPPGEDLGVKV